MLDWCILRPVLVISRQAYGGTALLRASAAMPMVGLLISPEAPVQTVSVTDVATAVADAAEGKIKSGTIADLTEERPQTLQELTTSLRAWQGYPPWRWTIRMPSVLARSAGFVADAFGWLGWRSPMRTNALRVLENGVYGDAEAWRGAGGQDCRPLLVKPWQRCHPLPRSAGLPACFWCRRSPLPALRSSGSVSYTHLTLPTIYSV